MTFALSGLRVALLALLLAGCAAQPRYNALAQDSRVLFVVLHYTVGDLASSLKTLTEGEVSAHYLVTDEPRPRVLTLVDESRRAWHAGNSAWQGHRMINASSIGIEIVNPGPVGGRYVPFADAQIDVLIPLLRDIVQRHGIRPERIVGHSDVQPQSKQDPGPAFPWRRLADAGLVVWPDAARVAERRVLFDALPPDVAWFQRRLGAHGFDVPVHGVLDAATRNVLAAFQMKYRPALHDGQPDAETAALLEVLTEALP